MIHRSIRISVLLVCMAMASTVARTQLQVLKGFAALFNVDRVTVVYPAETDGNPAVPRLSAERAAAFMQSKHGVIGEVVSDAAVTREQREGHLLLLGWNNLLLGTGKAPAPFIRRPDGYRLLGEVKDVVIQDAKDAIRAVLASGESMTEAAIAEEVAPEIKKTPAGNALREMYKAGEVRRGGSGGRGGPYTYSLFSPNAPTYRAGENKTTIPKMEDEPADPQVDA